MSELINLMPILLAMLVFWFGWELHSIKIQRMDRSIDKLEHIVNFLLYYLKRKDPDFDKEFEGYLDHLRNEE